MNVNLEQWGYCNAVSLPIGSLGFNPFTPKSDQRQNSPAASPEYDITQYGELGFS